jgi:hypothetical protein
MVERKDASHQRYPTGRLGTQQRLSTVDRSLTAPFVNEPPPLGLAFNPSYGTGASKKIVDFETRLRLIELEDSKWTIRQQKRPGIDF